MRRQQGFTYLGLLYAVALSGIALAGAGTLWSTDAKRAREAELLFVGEQFRHAILTFHEQAPTGQPHRFPRDLQELLDDKRWPTRRRHLRKVFVDPMTRSTEWGVVKAPGGGVMGVYSQSEDAPLKRAGFSSEHAHFADAKSYQDWQFAFAAESASSAASAPPQRQRTAP